MVRFRQTGLGARVWEHGFALKLGLLFHVASDKNHVLGALSSVASSIRSKLGESPTSIKKFNTPLEEVTPPSLEALQLTRSAGKPC